MPIEGSRRQLYKDPYVTETMGLCDAERAKLNETMRGITHYWEIFVRRARVVSIGSLNIFDLQNRMTPWDNIRLIGARIDYLNEGLLSLVCLQPVIRVQGYDNMLMTVSTGEVYEVGATSRNGSWTPEWVSAQSVPNLHTNKFYPLLQKIENAGLQRVEIGETVEIPRVGTLKLTSYDDVEDVCDDVEMKLAFHEVLIRDRDPYTLDTLETLGITEDGDRGEYCKAHIQGTMASLDVENEQVWLKKVETQMARTLWRAGFDIQGRRFIDDLQVNF